MRKLYLLILIELYINIFVHRIRLATNYKCSDKNQEIYHMSRFGNCRHHWPPIVGEERERERVFFYDFGYPDQLARTLTNSRKFKLASHILGKKLNLKYH